MELKPLKINDSHIKKLLTRKELGNLLLILVDNNKEYPEAFAKTQSLF